MENSKYTSLAAKLICIAAVAVFIWFGFEYAIGIIFPFAIAFCIGVPIYYLSDKIHQRTGFPRGLCAFVLVVLVLFVLSLVIFAALNRLFTEIEELIAWLNEENGEIGEVVGTVFEYVDNISSKIPFIEEIETIRGLENFRQSVDDSVSQMIREGIEAITSSIPSYLIKLIKHTPRVFISVIVTLLSCFYFATDYGRFKKALISPLSHLSREKIKNWSAIISSALKRYAKAYLLIMLITFIQVFTGLLILGKKYAFILALIVAVVDILPVFGAGTVLIPWALFSLLRNDVRTGLGLLILYGVVTIVRQIAEPKIVGDSFGVHPLITLIAMFAGFSLFGVTGMLISPAVLMLINGADKKID